MLRALVLLVAALYGWEMAAAYHVAAELRGASVEEIMP